MPELNTSGTVHSVDTSDAQTSEQSGATKIKALGGGGGGVEKIPNNQPKAKPVNIVTRAGAAKEVAAKKTQIRRGERGAKPIAPESISDIPLLQEVSENERVEKESEDDQLGCPEYRCRGVEERSRGGSFAEGVQAVGREEPSWLHVSGLSPHV